MEFPDFVLNGLNYLANGSYLSEDNFKKIVNSSLGLLAEEENIERITSICPEKTDIVRQAYAALLTFFVEVVRNNSEEEIKSFLEKQNIKSDRVEYIIKTFNTHKESIVNSLENCCSGWPNIVDANWRLDYVVKSNMKNHIGEPLYYIVLTTEKDGKLDCIRFTCTLHQLQELSIKLKEIVLHIEKFSSS